MKKTYSYSYSPLVFALTIILGLLATTLFVLELGEMSPAQAQAGPCDPASKPPVRPTDPNKPFIRQNETVYVIINSSITATTQINQIGAGLASWNSANSMSGGTGIQFTIGAPPANGPFPGNEQPTVIYFQNANLGNPNVAAQTTYNGHHADGSLASATITFNTGAMASPGNPSSGPFYDPNLPIPPGQSSNGYNTIFQKETEHEIGHPMGLADHNGPNGGSVMNNAAANCANDVCGRKPVNVAPCDRTSSQDVPRPLDTGNGGDPGGGGGGGDSGDCPCGDCTYGCSGGGGDDGSSCGWVDVGGQCYAGVDSYDYYGVLNGHEDGYCDPPQPTVVCW
jgi:hypothetical protein